MSYRVRLLRRARQDVDAILSWIANERKSPKGAADWLSRYEEVATGLAHWPESHGLALEDEFDDRELRQFLFKTRRGRMYRGIFTIQDDEVLILRVRGPGQQVVDPDDLPRD
jgi:plasmid stabilization system protein ParE